METDTDPEERIHLHAQRNKHREINEEKEERGRVACLLPLLLFYAFTYHLSRFLYFFLPLVSLRSSSWCVHVSIDVYTHSYLIFYFFVRGRTFS